MIHMYIPIYSAHTTAALLSYSFYSLLQWIFIAGLALEFYVMELYECEPPETYFFPTLLQVESPTDVWQNSVPEQYQCGLSLQCFEWSYFSQQFLHAFSLALVHDSCQTDKASALPTRCAIQKSGIQWLDQDGVETIVKVLEWLQKEREELVGVQFDSLQIPNVFETTEKFCSEIFTKPSNSSSYPLPELCQQLCQQPLLSSVISKWLSGEWSRCSNYI